MTRRVYGQRSRSVLARENSPVSVFPRYTPVDSRGRSVGQAGIGQRLVRDVQRQPVRQVRRAVSVAGDVEARAIEFVALDQRRLHGIGAVGRVAVRGE